MAADAAQQEFMGPDIDDHVSGSRPEPHVDGGLLSRVNMLNTPSDPADDMIDMIANKLLRSMPHYLPRTPLVG